MIKLGPSGLAEGFMFESAWTQPSPNLSTSMNCQSRGQWDRGARWNTYRSVLCDSVLPALGNVSGTGSVTWVRLYGWFHTWAWFHTWQCSIHPDGWFYGEHEQCGGCVILWFPVGQNLGLRDQIPRSSVEEVEKLKLPGKYMFSEQQQLHGSDSLKPETRAGQLSCCLMENNSNSLSEIGSWRLIISQKYWNGRMQ